MIAPGTQGTEEQALLTIGYEGLDLARFLKCLKSNKVKMLVDVRELPFSRKKGFSKTLLSEAMNGAGITYRHLRALGSPAKIRKRVKVDRDYATFFRDYDAYLETQEEAIADVAGMISEYGRVCLMCYEANPEECHRSHVADYVAREMREPIVVKPVLTWVRQER